MTWETLPASLIYCAGAVSMKTQATSNPLGSALRWVSKRRIRASGRGQPARFLAYPCGNTLRHATADVVLRSRSQRALQSPRGLWARQPQAQDPVDGEWHHRGASLSRQAASSHPGRVCAARGRHSAGQADLKLVRRTGFRGQRTRLPGRGGLAAERAITRRTLNNGRTVLAYESETFTSKAGVAEPRQSAAPQGPACGRRRHQRE